MADLGLLIPFIIVGIGATGLAALVYCYYRRCRWHGWQGGTASREKLVVGMHPAYKPYEFVSEGADVIGFDVDFARDIARRLGFKLSLKTVPFHELSARLESSDVDMIMSGIGITEKRLKMMEMVPYHGRPVRTLSLVFWGEPPAGVTSLETFESLPGATVSVQVGTLQEEILRRYLFIEPRLACTADGLLTDIRHGEAHAALVTHTQSYRLRSEYPKIKVIDVEMDKRDWVLGDGIGIRKGNTALLREVSHIVKHMREDGTASRLQIRWFSGVESARPPIPTTPLTPTSPPLNQPEQMSAP